VIKVRLNRDRGPSRRALLAMVLIVAFVCLSGPAPVWAGSVYAWGDSYYGQLGNGEFGYSDTPVQVPGIGNVRSVAGGGGFSLALKTDGTVWAWGRNNVGQLGNGSTVNSSVPVEVSGLTGVTGIAAGADHSLALRIGGTVWAWGDNGAGELGNGSTVNSSVPVEVSGLTGVTAIAAGGSHSLAVTGDITAPTTIATVLGPAGQNGWYTGPVTVTLSATDPDGPSDLLVTYYSLDGGMLQTYTAPFIISGDARHTLSFWSEDHAGNHEATQTLTVPITGPTATIPAGISMVSEPFANSGDLAALFGLQVFADGSADAAIYDPVASQYLLYPHLMGADGKSGLPGRGYWVLESKPVNLQNAGPYNQTPLDITLSPGWNMISDPFPTSLPISSLQIELSQEVGATPANQFISESAAVSAGIIGGTLWTYDTGGRQYTAASALTPFEGYWIYVDPAGSGGQPVTLRFTEPAYTGVPAGM